MVLQSHKKRYLYSIMHKLRTIERVLRTNFVCMSMTRTPGVNYGQQLSGKLLSMTEIRSELRVTKETSIFFPKYHQMLSDINSLYLDTETVTMESQLEVVSALSNCYIVNDFE